MLKKYWQDTRSNYSSQTQSFANTFIFNYTMSYVLLWLLSLTLQGSYTTLDQRSQDLWWSETQAIYSWVQSPQVWASNSISSGRLRLDWLDIKLDVNGIQADFPLPMISGQTAQEYIDKIDDRDRELMSRICKYGKLNGKVSPMCQDWDLYQTAKAQFAEIPKSRPIALGIMYSESHIWVSYAGSCDQSWNNRWGIKGKKLDNGKLLRDQPIPNNGNGWYGGCRLYKFDNLKDYFKSKANTLIDWYRWCWSQAEPIKCISYRYVGKPNVAEQSWIRRVATISE